MPVSKLITGRFLSVSPQKPVCGDELRGLSPWFTGTQVPRLARCGEPCVVTRIGSVQFLLPRNLWFQPRMRGCGMWGDEVWLEKEGLVLVNFLLEPLEPRVENHLGEHSKPVSPDGQSSLRTSGSSLHLPWRRSP